MVNVTLDGPEESGDPPRPAAEAQPPAPALPASPPAPAPTLVFTDEDGQDDADDDRPEWLKRRKPNEKGPNGVIFCEDEAGRRIGWKPLTALEDFDLTEIAGPENSRNDDWMLRASTAYSIRDIDGDRVRPPRTKQELRFMVARLDTAGFLAVMASVGEENAAKRGGKSDLQRAKN